MMDNNNRLPLQVIDARNFTWRGREGVAFASDLRGFRVSRIFKDACDWGFDVYSPTSGRTLTFVHAGTLRNVEEAIGDVFRSIGDEGITIQIFND